MGKTASSKPTRTGTECDPSLKGLCTNYRLLVETAGDLIQTLDTEGRISYCNPASLRILGFAPDELIGRHFTEMLGPESRGTAFDFIERHLYGQELEPFFEVTALHKHNGVRCLEFRGCYLVESGTVVGWLGIARDITTLKALHREVAKKSERMEMLEEQTRVAMALYQRIARAMSEERHAPPGACAPSTSVIEEAPAGLDMEQLGLSAGDLKLVALLAQGYSNREIATMVSRSPNTIKSRISYAMRRLGTHNRAALVAEAERQGLIDVRILKDT
jgi:PAS domain S-box-containing protein